MIYDKNDENSTCNNKVYSFLIEFSYFYKYCIIFIDMIFQFQRILYTFVNIFYIFFV